MPTYQYRCTSCDTDLEAVQKFSDDPLTVCPECQGNLRKVFSAVGVVFKGSGFYATDNRAKTKVHAAKSSEQADAKSSEKTDAKSGGKTDAKPREKTEGKPAGEARPKREAKRASSTGESSAA